MKCSSNKEVWGEVRPVVVLVQHTVHRSNTEYFTKYCQPFTTQDITAGHQCWFYYGVTALGRAVYGRAAANTSALDPEVEVLGRPVAS